MNADWFKMSLITSFVLMFLVVSARAADANYHDYVVENTKPIGEITVGGPVQASALNAAPKSGKDVYAAGCSFCHDTGAAGSPRLGNKAAWAPRIAQGLDTLVNHALHGFNAMPAKGMCPSCTPDDIKAAVQYMVDNSK